MSTRPPDGPNYPESPDELEGGLRGPIGGVTRIGPRAFGLAFLVICGLLIAILYGLNRGSSFSKGPQTQAFNTPPPAPPSGEARFGANEPLIAPSAPGTEPPALLLPVTPAPDLAVDRNRAAPAATVQPQAPQQTPDASAQRDEQARVAAAAAAEQARADEERKRREQMEAALKSPILAGKNSDETGGQAEGGGSFAGNGDSSGANASYASYAGGGRGAGFGGRQVADAPAQAASTSPSAFLNGPTGEYGVQPANVNLPAGGNPKDFLQAQRFAPISPYEVVASSVIPATMITSIDTELPALLSAQVREDIYDSKTGRFLLIPKGSRLVGLDKNEVSYGQSRVFVAWTRLIFPDTTSIDLQNMPGADVEGAGGLAGKVDNHYGRIFGAAILTSVLAAGVQLSQPQNSSILNSQSSGQILGQAVGQQIANVGTQIIQKNLNVPPTIHIPRGYPFVVMVDRDIVLPGPYGSGR